MLDLLKGIEDLLLLVLWSISAALVFLALITAVALSVRRFRRNHRDGRTRAREKRFEAFLQKKLSEEEFASDLSIAEDLKYDRTAITTVLLKFFKMVRGEDLTRLKILVEEQNLEPIIVEATRKGNRGKRMRALNALSFLDSRSSLLTIADNLYSEDKYIRLSVARCLARRNVLSLLSEVTQSIATAFPKDQKIMADVMVRFGSDAIPQLEQMVKTDRSNTVKSGAIEALILLRPAKTTLDLEDLMAAQDNRVRAGTVDFSTVCEHSSSSDILQIGLRDESLKVKIRSLKVAFREQRSNTFKHIYPLIYDENLWVRYWAMRAALKTGKSGETLLRSLARQDGLTGILAGKVMLEGEV